MTNGKKRVIVEIRMPRLLTAEARLSMVDKDIVVPGFEVDREYKPVLTSPRPELAAELTAANEEVVLIRGTIEEGKEQALRDNPRVINVWTDSRIEPFKAATKPPSPLELELGAEAATSPCSPYDCNPNAAKGDLKEVAHYLGADWIWEEGYRGKGIVIGICDTGVRKKDMPAFIGGWSPPGGSPPGDNNAHYHGTMCAVDAVGVCPDAKILDIGVLKSQAGIAGLLSDAIAAYQWALSRYHTDGTPQVLSNSWGIYQKSWAPDYACDPNHPFTRKVLEVIDAGILVCFAAGNCGEVCPSSRCGSDTGPGKSIWGANGHPKVITVGAANIKNEWIGYTSQGPACVLQAKKPDVCAPSHFKGYTSCDNGTSAACPVLAGVLGLLRNAMQTLQGRILEQDLAMRVLQKTARDICSQGWDPHSGHGIIQAKAAYQMLFEPPTPPHIVKQIEKYAVLHYRDGTTRINIYFTDGSWDFYTKLDPAKALLLVDLLRNEKPVFWTEGPDILWTGREPVGEEEVP